MRNENDSDVLVTTSNEEALLREDDAVVVEAPILCCLQLFLLFTLLPADSEGDSGVLVVTSDEEELLLEDDAVVVAAPKAVAAAGMGNAATVGTPLSAPLPPPPAAEVCFQALLLRRCGC